MAEGIGFGKRRLINEIVLNNWQVQKPEDMTFKYNELLFVIQEMLDQEGKKYLVPGEYVRGHEIFRSFVKHLLYRNIANYDSMILITAEKGVGKSSAAIMLAREWCKVLGIKFDPARHIAYSNTDASRKIDTLNKFEPLIMDESVRFASSEDWAKRENKDLKKKFAQVRTKHLLFILCFPLKVYKLEKTYLESFTNYWVDLFGRGKGAIYVKDKNPILDSWRLKEFEKIGSYTEFTDISKIKERLKQHPNFWQIINFPKPPTWLYSKYLKVREHNVYDEETVIQTVSKEDIYNAVLILALKDIMTNDVTLTTNRIILHIKNNYDINLSKQMVQDAIKDAEQLIAKVRENAISLPK